MGNEGTLEMEGYEKANRPVQLGIRIYEYKLHLYEA